MALESIPGTPLQPSVPKPAGTITPGATGPDGALDHSPVPVDASGLGRAGDRSTLGLPSTGSIAIVTAKVIDKDLVPVLPPRPELPAVSAKTIEPDAGSKPPQAIRYSDPPAEPEFEKVIEVAGSGMGADKKFKMYPSELAALYAILKEKGTMSLQEMQKCLKDSYGIDTEIKNGTIVNTANGHELIADTNGNGALDLGDLQFDKALKEAGIDPASLGVNGAGGVLGTVTSVAYWANYWAEELNKSLKGTDGSAAERPEPPRGLYNQEEVARRVKRLSELVDRERHGHEELLSLKLTGDRGQVASAKQRHDAIIQEIERRRHDEMLPLVKELSDFNKAAETFLHKKAS